MNYLNMFSLEGKNAWVTGASYGIGFNIAKAFAEAGVKNIIFNDINEEFLQKGLANYKEAGIENVHGYVCDVTNEDQVNAMIAQIERDVMEMYECCCDSVGQAPYFEFAVNHIASFLEIMGEYQKENVCYVVDPELNSILSAVYMKKLTACNDTLWQKAGKLQSLHKCGLPLDAVLFYDSLVGGRHRYVPYE